MPVLAVSNSNSSGEAQAVAVGAGETTIINWQRTSHRRLVDKVFEIKSVNATAVTLRVYRSSIGTKSVYNTTTLDTNQVQVGADTALAGNAVVALAVTNFSEYLKLIAFGAGGSIHARLVSAYAGQEGPQ